MFMNNFDQKIKLFFFFCCAIFHFPSVVVEEREGEHDNMGFCEFFQQKAGKQMSFSRCRFYLCIGASLLIKQLL